MAAEKIEENAMAAATTTPISDRELDQGWGRCADQLAALVRKG